ncbi:putative aspartyl aminopeptidase [Paramicrosporidium saccamoebae]|uniref:aspartyl aminopeptidase n=1 Tax=Paramicrosporidium saccamoebae TaxID=1246581 RepID=A0A2H9TPZ1_9FUNG|nr:putative aspartyl aminopeptidase [Paramicrosporidium saccamoebae]
MNTGSIKSSVAALLKFLDASPSPFHAVEECRQLLEAAGFQRLSESAAWKLNPNGRYFFTRNGSSLVAFTVGGQVVRGIEKNSTAVKIVAAHTDSPCLRVKPLSKKRCKDGFLQVAVETYGGGLWHTWFDRDLGVAGRLVTASKEGTLRERLVKIDRPILRVPTLAIHLDRGVNSEGFKFNSELQLIPILASETMNAKNEWINAEKTEENSGLHQSLFEALRDASKSDQDEIVGLDLCLFDVQKASLGGVYNEFIQSARLDNLFMTFTGLQSFIDSLGSVEKDGDIRMLSLFDNEEVGSLSSSGAESTLVGSTVNRILSSLDSSQQTEAVLARSFLLSADMAHAVHPNYSDKHDECHRPTLHKGIVLKFNSNQRYTTNSRSAAFIKSLASKNGVPLQDFMVRNDSPCGSTIGPILAAQLGLQAVDVGAPQLSMHSIREMAGTEDVEHSIRLFRAFYEGSSGITSVKTLDCCE